MKKYLLLLTLLFSGLYSISQDLENIKKMIMLAQYEKAKPDIDSYLSNEKNALKAEAWYFKAFIYNSLGRVATKSVAESKGLYMAAFDGVKKYAQLDPKTPLTIEENHSTVFNIYYGVYDLGIKTYNEKNYAESYDLFTKSLDIHDYIYNNKFIGPGNFKASAHDTDLVWNLAILANELKKKDEALVYFKKIADANLNDEKYATAYDELIQQYHREKNAELFAKYITAAKKHYPIDLPYWETKEIEFAVGDLEGKPLLDKYEELTKALPNNYVVFYNYAIEIDKFITTDTSKGKNINSYWTKMEELYKKSVSIKSTLGGNLQLAKLYYSKTFDLQERIAKIKGTKPTELKVKNELIAESKALSVASIPYAEEAVKILGTYKEYKFSEKANYKDALEILGNGYKVAGNAAKVAEVEKKKIEVEKL